jgi:tRNA(Ile)-lysidine synthase TilS/MesJ
MEIIRPLYLIREEDIIAWKNFNHLRFIQCACRFTENCAICDNGGGGSQRYNTKLLIQELKEKYSPMVEKNIFRAASNVNLDMILSYKKDGQMVSFLDHYEEEGKRNDERIRAEGLEAKAEAKAMAEHRPLKVDESFEAEKKE